MSEISNAVETGAQWLFADLPWADKSVAIELHARKFFCDDESCPRQVFCERLGEAVPVYARRTMRTTEQLRAVAFAVGSKPGYRLMAKLNLAASATTLLRIMRSTLLKLSAVPRVLGIDDWAIRKRHSYGAILVDLERRQPVDWLPECTTASLAAWLRAHPGVEIISRDRATEIAEAASATIPEALQIADRFHLLCNLHDTVRRFMAKNGDALRRAAQDAATADDADTLPEQPRPPTYSEQRFAAVKALQAEGWKRKQIARHLDIDRRTVSRYFRYDEYPRRAPGCGPKSAVLPYLDHVVKRWQEDGCRNRKQIYSELRARGFKGSYGSVLRAINRALRAGQLARRRSTKVAPRHRLSTVQAAWLLVRKDDGMDADDRARQQSLREADPNVEQAYELAQRFGAMIRKRESENLDPWLADANESGFSQFRRFAESLSRDYAAVRAALEHPWSNGQVEGHIHRVKLLKRRMFGRANFDLLRLHVLYGYSC